jgi:hypothetical protein
MIHIAPSPVQNAHEGILLMYGVVGTPLNRPGLHTCVGVRGHRASKILRSRFKILRLYNINYILFILIKYYMCINRLILRS